MHVDLAEILGGGLVGFTVGLTGVGGGALMTPMLVLIFGVNPATAVSSDLFVSLVMKPVGATVHLRRGTVNWAIARWLALGSVPAAFAGVFVLDALGRGRQLATHIDTLLGCALLVAALSMAAKTAFGERDRRATTPEGMPTPSAVPVKPIATLLIGVAGGFIVGMTSVGSGSLMMVLLVLLYPRLRMRQLVGTDLVQAIPLVGAATLSHALFGHIDLALSGFVLLGSVPGVYLGARVSSRAPDGLIRPALVLILIASALKLLGVTNTTVAWAAVMLVVAGISFWGAAKVAARWRVRPAALRPATYTSADVRGE